MENTLIAILLGHWMGDYLFQPRHMARRKIYSSTVCALHCAIYTGCTLAALILCGVLPPVIPDNLVLLDYNVPTLGEYAAEIAVFAAFVFGSHFLIDRTSFFRIWMKLVLREDMADFINLETRNKKTERINASKNTFNTISYVVLDNGAHILLSLLAVKILF